MRSIRGSSSKLPSRVPRLSGRRLEARRVLRKRATARNNVDRGIPSCARAALATSAVTFQPDCRNKSLSTAARRSTSGSSGSFGSTKPDDIASRYSRSTGRSIPFQVYKNTPPVPIWMPRKTKCSRSAKFQHSHAKVPSDRPARHHAIMSSRVPFANRSKRSSWQVAGVQKRLLVADVINLPDQRAGSMTIIF